MNWRLRQKTVPGKGRSRRQRFALEPLESRRLLAWQYTVSVAADRVDPLDNSFLSLREAIAYSNSGIAGKSNWAYSIGGSTNQIVFQIKTGSTIGLPQTLTLSTPLPALTAPAAILAQSQGVASDPSGQANLYYNGPQLITLNGSGLSSGTQNGIELAANNCALNYLIITNFRGAGVLVSSGQGSVVTNNRIGVNIRDEAAPNGTGVLLTGGVGTQIGTLTGPNVISGNGGHGVLIDGASNSSINGNFIGTNLINTSSLSVLPISNGGDGVLVRGTTNPSPNNTISNNVIAGNLNNGVEVSGATVTGTVIRSNSIGAGPGGQKPLSNNSIGVLLTGTSGNTISGNTIVANKLGGVQLRGLSNSNVLQGNMIGVAADGVTVLGNSGNAVAIFDGSNNTIGGSSASQGNTIAGAIKGGGILIAGQNATPQANVIRNNMIGTDSSGMTVIGNDNCGIELAGAANTIIGGGAGQGNVIGGSGLDGILIRSSSYGTIVQGNLIGISAAAWTAPDSAGPVSNLRHGVHIVGSSNNTIGMTYVGPPPGQVSPETYSGSGNVIAFNSYPEGGTANSAGIYVESGTGNSLLRNSIFDNLGLGIDLDPVGVNPNEPSPGSANNGQPSPIVQSARNNTVTGLLDIRGKINTPAGTYHIEFFSNPASDPTSTQSGRNYIGSVNVIVSSTGSASINTSLPVTINPGDLITATATRLEAASSTSPSSSPTDTSELSKSVQVDARADVAVAMTASPSAQVGLNDYVTFTVTISNNGPNPASGIVLHDDTTGLSYPIADLPSRASFTQVIRERATALTAVSGLYITKTVSVSSNEIDADLTNNTASAPNAPGVEVIRIGGSIQFDRSTVSTPMPGSATDNYTVNVSRLGGVNGTAQVDYTVQLVNPSDAQYAPTGYPATIGNPIVATGTLTFADLSSANLPITFPIFAIPGSAPLNHNVAYTITLSNVRDNLNGPSDQPTTLGTPSTQTLTVVNTNPPPVVPGSLAMSQATYTATASSQAVTVVVNRVGGSDGQVTVQLSTSDGSAIAGVDYQATTQTITFANGDVSPKTVTIPLIDRKVYSASGVSFQVILSAATGGAALGTPSSSTVQVQQDGTPPQPIPGTLQFATTAVVVNETDGFARLTVSRVSGSSGVVGVSYSTVAGTALAGRDFVPTTGTLTFASGQTTQTLAIPILRNGIVTDPLFFQIVLSSATGGASIGSASSATVQINNVDIDQSGPVVTGLSTNARNGSIVSYVVTFDRAIDPASASRLANYQVFALGANASDRKASSVAIASARLDATGTVLTLTPRSAQTFNRFYKIAIDGGAGGLISTAGNLIDGDGNGLAGGNFSASIGRGSSLSYVDAGGNLISLALNKAQSIQVTRDASGQGQVLTLFGLRRRRTVLAGSVRALSSDSTGRTSFAQFVGTGGLGDVRYRMTTPPITVQQVVPGGPASLGLAARAAKLVRA